MNHDEDMILGYLRKFPNAFVSAMEICKRAGDRRRFASEPDWAKPVLVRMTQQHILESNITGQYRIKPEEEEGEEPKKHGRPYEPRPEPAPPTEPVAAAAQTDLTKATTVTPSGELQKTPAVEAAPQGAPAPDNGEKAKKDAVVSIPQVESCKDSKTNIPSAAEIPGHAGNKKAA